MNKKRIIIFVAVILAIALVAVLWRTFYKEEITTTNLTADTGPINETAYIKNIFEIEAKTYAEIDMVEWLSGDEAKNAALADGDCMDLQYCAPNGIYIRNTNTDTQTFEIDPAVVITRVSDFDFDPTGIHRITLEEFKTLFRLDAVRVQNMPFVITGNNGIISRLNEKFLP